MSTPNIASPPGPIPFPSNDQDSAFDFLSFMGIDASSTSPYSNADASIAKAREDDEVRGGSSRGRTKARSIRGRGDRSTSGHRDAGMEVDSSGSSGGSVVPYTPSQMLGMSKGPAGGMEFGFGASIGHDFDASQAQLLQQQLEHIHMQSPLTFEFNNSQSPYNPIAQMLLTSPMEGMNQLPTHPSSVDGQNGTPADEDTDRRVERRIPVSNGYGMFTPAPSGDMFPQSRTDKMSPMHLEMLARGEHEFSMTPLLSPALPNQHNNIQASPGSYQAFAQAQSSSAVRSPLEQLQEQQKQFQEQLAILQQQQRELQATAAAVAASTNSASAANSPYMPTQGSRHGSTPGYGGSHSNGCVNTPSPQYFSPLTSPAIEQSRTGFPQQQYHRTPHPLSALSSPALNPVGSSGGAQQTLSPALEPQSNNDMADPEYVRALVGMLDGSQQDQNSQVYNSPNIGTNQYHSSPLVGPTPHTGPNRQSLPIKTRPSPMMKPVGHRSHGKHTSNSGSGNFPIPTSPAIQRVVAQGVMGMGYLPPAAIQPNYPSSNSGGNTSHSALTVSTTSTPSPVDLNQLMPPPPVPGSGSVKGVTPMTPASLMNLGDGIERGDNATPVLNPKRQATKSAPAPAPAPTKVLPKRTMAPTAKKATTTSRLPAPGMGKRTLAMRPPGGVGVRTATKGAATAASLALPEGETRKTSHKAAEQKRRDSLKAGFDELRLLLPPINTEALDPESGEPIPGSSAPRLLPKSSLVPDDNPNRGVSKVALLKFSNEYIVRLHEKVDKRDDYIERLRMEVSRLRSGEYEEEVTGEEGEDLLEMDMLEGEEEDFGDPIEEGELEQQQQEEDEDAEMDDEDDEEWTGGRKKGGRNSTGGVGRRPSLGKRASTGTVKGGR